jgi:hypothetical protein
VIALKGEAPASALKPGLPIPQLESMSPSNREFRGSATAVSGGQASTGDRLTISLPFQEVRVQTSIELDLRRN